MGVCFGQTRYLHHLLRGGGITPSSILPCIKGEDLLLRDKTLFTRLSRLNCTPVVRHGN